MISLSEIKCGRLGQLLLSNDGNEDVLGQYGFNVVVGTAKSPVRSHSPAPVTT